LEEREGVCFGDVPIAIFCECIECDSCHLDLLSSDTVL
jgi:hypothetical protein